MHVKDDLDGNTGIKGVLGGRPDVSMRPGHVPAHVGDSTRST